MPDEPHEYEVGYKKPPAHSRWQPGCSGNPKGRPKKIKDFEKLLDVELDQTLRVTEGGETRVLTKRQIILKKLVNDALKGDLRALKMLLPFLVRQQTVEGFEPDAADRQALQQLLGQFRGTDGQDELKGIDNA